VSSVATIARDAEPLAHALSPDKLDRSRGELALVLHTHMPYVEGFGTWPFGEEWLWEAMATCYLPLLAVLERSAAPTLSLTPVLCDQLAAEGVGERFVDFLEGTRRETHRLDIDGCRASGAEALAIELERAAQDYERALECFAAIDGDLLGGLLAHTDWTSAATHAVLPLCATDAGARLQIESGIAAFRDRHTKAWRGGFWLPECGYAPWLDTLLGDAGVHVSCVDLTDRFGYGAPEHLRPLRTEAGVVLAPIDRATIELVWSDRGYPAHGSYRDYHRHTIHHHNPWANDGSTYDHTAALALVGEHAADFVGRTRARLDAAAAAHGRPGLAVCTRQRAARALVVRRRRLARCRARGVRTPTPTADEGRGRTRAGGSGAGRRRRARPQHVGVAARPVDVGRAGGCAAGVGDARRRAAGGARGRRGERARGA
jgi:1,4-alpha-glucan branching enzyme